MTNFTGLNIWFWNCQGIRPKHKELELYLKENSVDIIALNETFLNKKYSFKIPGYDTIRNDRSTGRRGGVAFLVKHGLVINTEYRNEDFNIITENEALAINLELSHDQNQNMQLGHIPTTWKVANLRMLLKPDKLPSLTTSYRPISLISSIMKLFERVIGQRLRSHLEHIGFINKHQSGFRKAKSIDDTSLDCPNPLWKALTEENML